MPYFLFWDYVCGFAPLSQVKVNDECEFPMELDMRPYTKEGLARQQRQQVGQKNEQRGHTASVSSSGSSSSAEKQGKGGRRDPPGDEESYPDAYYEYKLAGVLVHMGTADSGHYYSYIKRRDSQV